MVDKPKINYNPINNKVEVAARNFGIAESWNVMTAFTKMSYREKLDWLMERYNLSEKSCEEDVVNAMSNGMTELLTRTDLLQFIKHKLKEV